MWALAGVLWLCSFALDPAYAKSEAAWICAYKPLSASGPSDAVVMQLVRDANVLQIRGAEFIEYQIIEDNDVGSVAVKSYAEASDGAKHLGSDVLVIDKVTMDFRKGNVFVPGARADNGVHAGTCVRN